MRYYRACLTAFAKLVFTIAQDYPECIYGEYKNQSCFVHECEVCDPDSVEGCVLQGGWCRIRSFCYADGHAFTQKSGLSNCQVCDISRDISNWSPAYTGNWCSDNLYCNGEDSCVYDEASQTSQCTVHAGDPCAANTDMCNNTCVEKTKDTPGNCHTGEVTCGASTVCADYKCSEGSCQMFAYGADVYCGPEDACTESVCMQGSCAIGHPKTDGTACGASTECVEHVCASGQCVERPPNPAPHCDVCPCSGSYYCDTNSGLCIAEEKDDNRLDVALIVGVSVGSVVVCAVASSIAFFVVFKSRNPVLGYALLDAEDDDRNAERPRIGSDVPTVHPVAVPSGNSYLTRAKAAQKTKYIREDEPTAAVVINKKL